MAKEWLAMEYSDFLTLSVAGLEWNIFMFYFIYFVTFTLNFYYMKFEHIFSYLSHVELPL